MFEILSPTRMRDAERCTIDAGTDSFALMRTAGAEVVSSILEVFPEPANALVLCGPGNNGGDGYIVAALLAQAGWAVRVAALVPPETLKGDVAKAVQMWTCPATNLSFSLPAAPLITARPILPWHETEPEDGDIVIDAVFGTGFSGNLPPAAVELFAKVRRRLCPVVAVDIPSGVDAATASADPAALAALMTVTFFRKKTGHVLLPGLERCGEIIVRDIGIAESALENARALPCENAPGLWQECLGLKNRIDAGNKYDRGHALILAGPRMTGAAMMAAHAACRAGVGLCTLIGFPHFVPYFANMMGETIERFQEFPKALADSRKNLLLLGPGAGQDDPEGLRLAVQSACADPARRVVLDADALNVFAKDPGALFAGLHEGCILTPHAGEFGRLFPGLSEGTKIDRTRAAAYLSGATVVFKGADTVIAAPDGRVAVNTHASPDLATAGSGDVLAGLILGFLGRGGRNIDGFWAACAAAWIHGEAALRYGPGLMATDIPDLIPPILDDLRHSVQL